MEIESFTTYVLKDLSKDEFIILLNGIRTLGHPIEQAYSKDTRENLIRIMEEELYHSEE